MSALSFSVLFGFCLLFTGASVSAKDQAAHSTVADALFKIKNYPAYRLTRTYDAFLTPDGAGVMVPAKIAETSVMLVARKGSRFRAHESFTTRTILSPLLPISRTEKETGTVVWDGKWIYHWGKQSGPTKMLDAEVNRGANIIESLYTGLLKDDTLSRRGEESVDGQRCIVLESSADFLQLFLQIDGKVTILLNPSTGFPVKMTAKKQLSMAVFNYTKIETNPTYSPDIFVPPKGLTFERINGAEDMENDMKK